LLCFSFSAALIGLPQFLEFLPSVSQNLSAFWKKLF